MGVKSLWKLLLPAGRRSSPGSLSRTRLAIDFSIWLVSWMSYGDGNRDRNKGNSKNPHLAVLFSKICKLLFYNTRPVFVFDGSPPPIKRNTMLQRRKIALKREEKKIVILAKKLFEQRVKEAKAKAKAKDEAKDEGKGKGDASIEVREDKGKHYINDGNDQEEFDEDTIDVDSIDSESEFEDYDAEYAAALAAERLMFDDHDDPDGTISNSKGPKSKAKAKVSRIGETETTDHDHLDGIFQNESLVVQHEMLSQLYELRRNVAEEKVVNLEQHGHHKNPNVFAETQLAGFLQSGKVGRKLREIEGRMQKNVADDGAVVGTVAGDPHRMYFLFEDKGEDVIADSMSTSMRNPSHDAESAMPAMHQPEQDEVEDKGEELDLDLDVSFTLPTDGSGLFDLGLFGIGESKKDEGKNAIAATTTATTVDHSQVIDEHTPTPFNADSMDLDTHTASRLLSTAFPGDSSVVVEEGKEQVTEDDDVVVAGGESKSVVDLSDMSYGDGPSLKPLEMNVMEKIAQSIEMLEGQGTGEKKEKEKSEAVSVVEARVEAVTPTVRLQDRISDEVMEAAIELKSKLKSKSAGTDTIIITGTEVHGRGDADTEDVITDEVVADCKELMDLFGIPYVQAPCEAEAECASMLKKGLVDAIVSDDGDAFLFGAKRVYRNLFRRDRYLEAYDADVISTELGFGRAEIIGLALLLGSDYTPGVHGIGPVAAVEIIGEFFSREDSTVTETDVISKVMAGICKFADWVRSEGSDSDSSVSVSEEFASKHKNLRSKIVLPDASDFPSEAVIRAYCHPKIIADEDRRIEWSAPKLDSIRMFCATKMNWTVAETDRHLQTLQKRQTQLQNSGTIGQQRLDFFFQPSRTDPGSVAGIPDIANPESESNPAYDSVRLQKAVSSLAGRPVRALPIKLRAFGGQRSGKRKKQKQKRQKDELPAPYVPVPPLLPGEEGSGPNTNKGKGKRKRSKK